MATDLAFIDSSDATLPNINNDNTVWNPHDDIEKEKQMGLMNVTKKRLEELMDEEEETKVKNKK